MKINDKMLESQGSFYFVNRQFSCSLLSSIRPRGRNQCALWGPGQETEGLRKQGQLSWPFRCFGLCVLRTRNLTVACGRGQPRCGAPGWAEGPPLLRPGTPLMAGYLPTK